MLPLILILLVLLPIFLQFLYPFLLPPVLLLSLWLPPILLILPLLLSTFPLQIPPQPDSPPELTKLQHTYKTMLAIQLSCHLALLLLMYQALLMPLRIVSLIVIWMLTINLIS